MRQGLGQDTDHDVDRGGPAAASVAGRLDADVLTHVPGPVDGVRVPVADAQKGRPSIELDTYLDGPEGAPVILLVSGLAAQRINWPVELISALHADGYRTLLVDNRDCGRSTVLPDPISELPRDDAGHPLAPYGLDDMARDLVAVLDALELDVVDVIGTSMGGMIAQHLAFDHPSRVRTLTSVISTTGDPNVGRTHDRAKWVLRTPAPLEPDAYLEFAARCAVEIGSPGLDDPTRRDACNTVALARGLHPQGTARQLMAIRSDGDRTERLAGVRAPTLVLHGDADPLIDVSGGEATAAAVPDARFSVVAGMGHDLAVGHLDRILDAIRPHLAHGG